ncbi:MAG: ABC transporter permease [Acidobacteria bacterium]|nr:ABC transporter permease [Acidobacteriota bacterium]
MNHSPGHSRRISLLARILAAGDHLPLLGDLEEAYGDVRRHRGRLAAEHWYWSQVVRSVPPFLENHFRGAWGRLVNYLKSFGRIFLRQRLFSVINLVGLAIGIATCLLIFLFVADELSFDRFHKNRDRLFRVVQARFEGDTGRIASRSPYLPPALGPELKEYFPEIECQSRHMWADGVVSLGDRQFQETFHLVDKDFLRMFSFPLRRGDARTALANDSSLVLTRSLARKYFGGENPLGRGLTVTFGRETAEFMVTGVTENPPANSSITFDLLINIVNLPRATHDPHVLSNWQRWYFPLYVLLRPGLPAAAVERGMDPFVNRYFGEYVRHLREESNWTGDRSPFSFRLQNITDVYLDDRGVAPSVTLSVIAGLVLLVACINFMNIAIGAASGRSVEVGLRKVLGAHRRQLVVQFWGEAVLMSVAALGIGALLAGLLLTEFNALAEKSLSLWDFFRGTRWLAIPVITLLAGLVAGSYPALVMAAFRPVEVLKGSARVGGAGLLSRMLVTVQFVVSITLVITAIFLARQAEYLMETDLGYDPAGLVVILIQENDQAASEQLYARFREEVRAHSGVRGITASNREYGLFLPSTLLEADGRAIHYSFNRVDPDFIPTLGLKLAEGRNFSRELSSDERAVIVNECFLRQLGSSFAVGDFLGATGGEFPHGCRVIGVLEDRPFRSLRSEIEPVLLYIGRGFAPARDRFSRMLVRTDSRRFAETMKFLADAWRRVQPDKPFIHYVQDAAVADMYRREQRWSAILRHASVLSMVIAGLGIFGLTALTLSRRVKEIGIRKVLGASVARIIGSVLRDFVPVMVLANLIAGPVAWWILRFYLDDYPNRIALNFLVFLLVGLGSVLLAVLINLYLAVKAAWANPVESLRAE